MHHVYVVNKTHQMQKPLLPCILKMYFLFKQNCEKKTSIICNKKIAYKISYLNEQQLTHTERNY